MSSLAEPSPPPRPPDPATDPLSRIERRLARGFTSPMGRREYGILLAMLTVGPVEGCALHEVPIGDGWQLLILPLLYLLPRAIGEAAGHARGGR